MLNLWAHWVSLLRMSSWIRRIFYLSLFPFSFERTQTKTNNCTTIYLPTLAIHFVCSRFPFFPTFHHPTIHTVPNYHRRSLQLPIRSDRTARHSTLSFNISPVLALVLVTSAWTTINFHLNFLTPSSLVQRRRHRQQYQFSTNIDSSSTTPTITLSGTILSQLCRAYLY